ncbi:mammalian ependymin-related protein 1-like [Actinia tenebrosa]|uniref:Mammalian ependymin-related protein 1-like n=1 Tax=Actinia tenebrosa TaxID=6105 RepID=A0A6P8I695_ACTTE|nr:mammalian ependymin-related protein 1-like [Actinia tenebrosa]
MYAFAAFLVFAVVVNAQRPEPCEGPKVWEGKLFQVDHSKNFSILGKLSYDASNERVRIIEEINLSGGKRYFYDFIILYREQRLYRVELSINGTGKCVVSEFKESFRPAEIPKDAKFATEAYIGASLPEVGVLVNIFYGKEERKGVTVDYVATVTAEGCIPVSSVVYTQKTGAIHSSFFDIVLGIEDPERFVPPSSCEQVEHSGRIPMHL